MSGLGVVACLFRVRGTRENDTLCENLRNFQTLFQVTTSLCSSRFILLKGGGGGLEGFEDFSKILQYLQ
jgi:hypothetical protein